MMKLLICLIFALFASNSWAVELEVLKDTHPHPFDNPVPERMKTPDDFPLGPGRTLTCDTCHGIIGLKDAPIEKIDKKAPEFLRGGPYRKLIDHCYRCHEREEYKRPNIHKMLDEKGELKKERCKICHAETPDPEEVTDWRGLKFRLATDKLCLGCHLKTPHLNALNHQKKPTDEMKKVMEASEKRYGIILPLDEEGRVMCVTCHSPHEKGVIKSDRPGGRQVADVAVEEGILYVEDLWNKVFEADKKERLEELEKETGKRFEVRYRKIKGEVLLRLPAKDGTLCIACHQFKK